MEESRTETSSGQVTVEYSDPYDLYETVEPLLRPRLPLRNLHWKSSNRPLRSISTLQVSLKKAKDRNTDASVNGANQRRHQIPGLRETPYLKILLLRCDDSETYKLSARKAARDWVKNQTTSSQSTSSLNIQENHDAAEWLIIHVVLPDTPAASQPRTSKHSSSGPTDSTENVSGKSKWPGRGSSTLLDKLKSDFKSSSKASVDRVAQIRLPKASTTQNSAGVLSAHELEALWDDLIEKLKSLILASFDLRVQQYEEDIRERDSQRNLPGWNFCTFAVLKEGLARGFENVGLFEDALAGYDELGLGLDLIVREQALSGDDQHGGSFLHYTPELKKAAEDFVGKVNDVKDGNSDGVQSSLQSLLISPADFPINSTNKPYRELILANNISIFQFRSYIFSRQLTLLLRAGNAPSLFTGSSGNQQSETNSFRDEENLSLLADACHRAADFIGVGARTLRQDLEQGLGINSVEALPSSLEKVVINNMTSSWTFGVALQVLTQTLTPKLTVPSSTMDGFQERRSTSVFRRNDEMLPKLTLDLNLQNFSSTQNLSEQLSPPQSSNGSHLPIRSGASRIGGEKLASCRAELILLARRVLEELGGTRGWSCDWRDVHSVYYGSVISPANLEEISLDYDQDNEVKSSEYRNISLAGINQTQLAHSLTGKSAFEKLFELLTDHALRHYLVSNKTRSIERLTADIALLRYREEKFEAAAYHFSRLAPFYKECSWDAVGVAMLQLYAECLKQIGHNKEYPEVLLMLLATCASAELDSQQQLQSTEQLQPFIDDLFSLTDNGNLVTAELEQFYEVKNIPKIVSHPRGRDGFILPLQIRSRLGRELIRGGSLKLVLTATEPCAIDHIELEAIQPKRTTDQSLWYELYCNTTTWAKYSVSQVVLQVENICFTHTSEVSPDNPLDLRGASAILQQRTEVLVYPSACSLSAQLIPCSVINLSEARTIEIELCSGWNNIAKSTLRIKPATAGLRIKTRQGQVMEDGDAETICFNQPEKDQTITFSRFRADRTAKFSLPYTLENPDITTISAKIEVHYETEGGLFDYVMNASVNAGLALNVNVQDLFQQKCLFSRFTIGPATVVPVRLESCVIAQSEHYIVEGASQDLACDVFSRESASLLYKFTPRESDHKNSKPRPLELIIDYLPLDEWALKFLENKFCHDLRAQRDPQLEALKLPLLWHFLAPFTSRLAFNDLEMLGLLREIDVPSYDEFGWQKMLQAHGKTAQDVADIWLQEWHQENATIHLSEQPPFTRRIVVPVEILKPRYVVTALLELHCNPSVPFSIGQAVMASLQVSHHSRWTTLSSNESAVEFSYELFAPPELWLIGGRRKGSLTSQDEQKQVFPIMILPQRPGHLLLPTVEVKAFAFEKTESDVVPFKRTELRCEVDYRNHAQSVLVVPSLRETTVALDGEGSNRRSWLASSQARSLQG